MKNQIYLQAIENQKSKGEPIFLSNITITESRFFGANQTPKTFNFIVKGLVICGHYENMLNDKILLSKTLKEKAKRDGSDTEKKEAKTIKYRISDIDFVSFHGYANKY